MQSKRPNDINDMTIDELNYEKLCIKKELKSFHVSFSKKYGRMVCNINYLFNNKI